MSESINFRKFNKEDGVYILSELNDEFEKVYLEIRNKEKRVYTDKELRNLPIALESNSHAQEWKLRSKSFQRFRNYLKAKEQNLNILDLGCGNGWFCGQLSNSFNHNFYCVDVNLAELKQGRRNFTSEKLNFIYSDIFTAEFPNSFFDIIVVNAAVQYFRDLKPLINRFKSLSTEMGEIHIIDSPIYSKEEVVRARKRTQDYYLSLGFQNMTNNYFHHSWKEISEFNFDTLYNPYSLNQRLLKLLLIKDSPFPWIRINK
jgi:ubiquinone/menaquinone biosynthesis C-methylase UbiE